jgi:hypothetical protein
VLCSANSLTHDDWDNFQDISDSHVNRRHKIFSYANVQLCTISSSDKRRVAYTQSSETCMRSGQANEFVRQLKDVFVICKQRTRMKSDLGSSGIAW